MTYNRFTVVRVPFPFTDKTASKRRPALVISDEKRFNRPSGHLVLAMITTAKQSCWPLDVPLHSSEDAGLSVASIVRMKLFTLDQSLILGQLGELSAPDATTVQQHLKQLFAMEE
ncbi:MAG: type II toxin-antitoxin system PemK/MazF family toxin [Gammaproteobacteria bacterium]|nr:type II toxin-antitoxin system PemK/MazF family toxin [Gammaproteobacteria bacterium]